MFQEGLYRAPNGLAQQTWGWGVVRFLPRAALNQDSDDGIQVLSCPSDLCDPEQIALPLWADFMEEYFM